MGSLLEENAELRLALRLVLVELGEISRALELLEARLIRDRGPRSLALQASSLNSSLPDPDNSS